MQEQLKKQIKDSKRGAKYRTGIAIKDLAPSAVIKVESEYHEIHNIHCKFYGCRGKNILTNLSRNCCYFECRDAESLSPKQWIPRYAHSTPIYIIIKKSTKNPKIPHRTSEQNLLPILSEFGNHIEIFTKKLLENFHHSTRIYILSNTYKHFHYLSY